VTADEIHEPQMLALGTRGAAATSWIRHALSSSATSWSARFERIGVLRNAVAAAL